MSQRNKRFEWTGVVCSNDKTRAAVLSWFRPFVPEHWGLPLKCDLQVEIDTDREKAMRALFRLPDGSLREAQRRMGVRSTTFRTLPATTGILKDFRQ